MGPLSWPSSSAMGANGSSGANTEGTSSSQGQPQGTEYTLQGVMRFLQMQWHRHERDRNAWDVERAEMKMRIAKLEGDQRTNKKLQESLSNHVKILENALKREREKAKGGAIAEEPAAGAKNAIPTRKGESQKLLAADTKPPTQHHNSFLEVSDGPSSQAKEEPQRSKTRGYLDKSVQEVTYLLTAPSQPPPSQRHHVPSQDLAALHGYATGQDPIPILADVSSLQQPQQQRHHNLHQQQQQQQSDISIAQPSPSPRHQPPPVPSSVAPELGHLQQQQANKGPQPSQMTRHHPDQQPPSQHEALFPADNASRARGTASSSHAADSEEQLRRTTNQNYEVSGRSTADEPNITVSTTEHHRSNSDPDAWNFDEPESTSQNTQQRSLEVDRFPNPNSNHVPKSPPRTGLGSHRRKGSMSRRRSDEAQAQKELSSPSQSHMRADTADFKVRFALRGHLDVVRAVIFTGGGSPSEPEICTAGDDGVLKRWIIPASYSAFGPPGAASNHHHHHDLDVVSYFTHRGHTGAVTCLAACPLPQNFLTGGRALGDGWVFSGGQDATVKVWERGRVDPKATLVGHTDAVWSICVLPTTAGTMFGSDSSSIGGGDRLLLASGAADGSIKIWAVSAPPQSLSTSHSGSRRGVGGSRRHSVTSGSGFPSSPQPSTATSTPFHHTLVHTISRPGSTASPTCIAPASSTGNTFVAAYIDAAVIIYDTRTGEEVVGMASLETYDGTPATGVNSVVATTGALESATTNAMDATSRGLSDDEGRVHGATGSGSSGGVEGVVISGHEDRYIRFFDANSGQCTYTMLAHPSSISSLSLSPDSRELVSAGHDASLRFWSLEKRSCTQELTSHRLMRGEGVCAVVWSQDGRWVVSGGGDGVVKVFSR